MGTPASMGEQGDQDFFLILRRFLRGQGFSGRAGRVWLLFDFERISQRSGCVSVLRPWVKGEGGAALVCLGWIIARLPAASSGQPGLAQCPRDMGKSFDFCLEGSRVNPQLWLSCSALPAVLIEGTEKKPGSQSASYPAEKPQNTHSVQVPVWISASGSPKRGKTPSPGLVCQLGHSFIQPSLTL